MLQRLSALLLFLCLLAGESLALEAGSRCAHCAVRPCCPAMTGHAACAMHRPAADLAILHVHRPVEPRPAVVPEVAPAPAVRLAAHRPAPAAGAPDSPTAPPETPPPRLLAA